MRTPSSLVVVACVAVAAVACSRSKPPAPGHLDLVLDQSARAAPVASALEIWGTSRTIAAAPGRRAADARLHARPHARTVERRRPAPQPERAPVATPVPQPALAVSTPVPAPAPVPAGPLAATAPDPTPQPVDPARGGWSEPGVGGAHFPGFPGGGVIVIRGGHSGMDPCDEHGRGGMGGGMPTPVGIGHRFPGIRF